MGQRKSAASPGIGIAAAKHIDDTCCIIRQSSTRRQFFADSFGKFLTALIAAAEMSGQSRIVDDLLRAKNRWLRGARV